MNSVQFQNLCTIGMMMGLGIAVIPMAATATIAYSKIVLVNVIADLTIRILSAGRYGFSIPNVSFVEVPLLWQASLISLGIGLATSALSLIALAVTKVYQINRPT